MAQATAPVLDSTIANWLSIWEMSDKHGIPSHNLESLCCMRFIRSAEYLYAL